MSTVEEALLAGPARGPGKSLIRHAMQRDGEFRLDGYVFGSTFTWPENSFMNSKNI